MSTARTTPAQKPRGRTRRSTFPLVSVGIFFLSQWFSKRRLYLRGGVCWMEIGGVACDCGSGRLRAMAGRRQGGPTFTCTCAQAAGFGKPALQEPGGRGLLCGNWVELTSKKAGFGKPALQELGGRGLLCGNWVELTSKKAGFGKPALQELGGRGLLCGNWVELTSKKAGFGKPALQEPGGRGLLCGNWAELTSKKAGFGKPALQKPFG